MSEISALRPFSPHQSTAGTGLWKPEPASRAYSVFDSALDRMHNAKWLFHQEKVTLHDVGDVDK
jgi:hypothetical protein